MAILRGLLEPHSLFAENSDSIFSNRFKGKNMNVKLLTVALTLLTAFAGTSNEAEAGKRHRVSNQCGPIYCQPVQHCQPIYSQPCNSVCSPQAHCCPAPIQSNCGSVQCAPSSSCGNCAACEGPPSVAYTVSSSNAELNAKLDLILQELGVDNADAQTVQEKVNQILQKP